LAKISQVPNFGSGRIRPTCWNQNVTDWNIRHKIYISPLSIFLDSMREFNSSQIFQAPRCMFLTLRSTAAGDFRPILGRVDLLALRLCCYLRHLRSKKIVSLKPSLLTDASNRIQGTSHKNLNKNAAHIPRLHWNNCEKRQIDRVKNDFVPPLHAPNWTSRQSYFQAVILSRHVLKTSMTFEWLKKRQKCLLCQNFFQILAIRKNLASFWKWGRTYFTLRVDRCIFYANKIGASVKLISCGRLEKINKLFNLRETWRDIVLSGYKRIRRSR